LSEDKDLPLAESGKPPEKVFNLDNMPELWEQYVEKKKQQAQVKKWIDQFGDAFKRLAGDAKQLRLHGKLVGRLVCGQLNKTLLAQEQPHIIEKYTRTVTTQAFDEQAFKAENPEMYKQYQALRLTLAGEK
jgi:hypothetical protein